MGTEFDSNPEDIQNLFQGRKTLYKIPDYQRPYSWQKKHIDQLWEDLYGAWNSGSDEGSYFLGTVILVDDGDDRLDILDGQQRITTLMIFYAVLRDCFPEMIDDRRDTIERRIQDTSGDSDRYRLKTGEPKQPVFASDILSGMDTSDGGDIKDSGKNNYLEAAQYTKQFIDANFDDAKDLTSFFDFIELNTEIIEIVTSNLAYAIRLFQTVNTRGKDLTVSDLTKSLLLSLTCGKDDRSSVTEAWKNFSGTFDEDYTKLDEVLSSYRLYQQVRKADKSVYEELKGEFEDATDGDTSVVELAQDIVDYAEYYDSVESTDGQNVHMLSNLRHSRYWKTILTAAKKEGFDGYSELVESLVALYYSYWIAGHTSEKIKKPSYEILDIIKSDGDINDIEEYISDKRSNDSISQKVRNNLHSDVYDKNWHRRLLIALELEESLVENKIKITADGYLHREHILPKEFESAMKKYDYWERNFSREEAADLRHSLGNIIPLEQSVHSEVRQKPFDQKTDYYMGNVSEIPEVNQGGKATSWNISRHVVDNFDEWNSESVRKMRDYLMAKTADLLEMDESELVDN